MAKMPGRRRSARLLIVEHDESQPRTITSIMKDERFDVVGCSTASQALEHLARGDAGVAVVDLRLPDLSGTQLLERLPAVDGKVPVDIHNGFGSCDSDKKALNFAAFAYVEKGGDPGELVPHPRRAFRSRFKQYATDLESTVVRRTRTLEEANETLRPEITERERIRQVMLNLLRNGIRAMKTCDPDGRVLTIETSTAENNGIGIAVRDTGQGLAEVVSDKLLRPSFTIKHHGMGLGLPINRTIIDTHGGRLWAIRNPDRGATFKFMLPDSGGDCDHEN